MLLLSSSSSSNNGMIDIGGNNTEKVVVLLSFLDSLCVSTSTRANQGRARVPQKPCHNKFRRLRPRGSSRHSSANLSFWSSSLSLGSLEIMEDSKGALPLVKPYGRSVDLLEERTAVLAAKMALTMK